MKKRWALSILFIIIGSITSLEAASETKEEQSQTVVFDTFRADALNQKRAYGLGIDSFFGAAAMMQKAGQHSRSNPMPLLEKTLEGLEANEYDSDALKVILFYFSRTALKNPPVMQAYREAFQRGDESSYMLAIILWYAHDRQMQTIFRQIAREATNPKIRELFGEIYQDRSFINILPQTMPIKSCRDIEILWAEYLVNGDIKAIERIVEQVTVQSENMQQTLISVEAGSSLAQRGGWFEPVKELCEAAATGAVGQDRAIWEDILSRMKPLGNGDEVVKCPIQRIKLNGKEGRAMACEAIFPKKDNNGRLDVLGAYSLKCDNIQHTRNVLYKYWFNGGRFELLMAMEGLANEGHRAAFDKQVKQIIRMNDQQRELFISRKPLLEWPKWRIVCDYGPKMGDKSILAWDLSRICMLGRFGYEAQYLSPPEVYRVSIPAAIMLQETFDSWEDYGENFWVGRWYWRAEEKDRDAAKQAVEALLTEAGSPWKKYPWEMPMK